MLQQQTQLVVVFFLAKKMAQRREMNAENVFCIRYNSLQAKYLCFVTIHIFHDAVLKVEN